MTRAIVHHEQQHDLDAETEMAEDPDFDEQKAFGHWWAQLPDFIKPGYPLDLPPARMPFARHVFGLVGAPRLCPEIVCRRSGACRGGDGPPCYRADRDYLAQVLFLWWMRVFEDLSYEEYERALRLKGSPYAPPPEETAEAKSGQARRRRGRR
jgi:hypothetical protein